MHSRDLPIASGSFVAALALAIAASSVDSASAAEIPWPSPTRVDLAPGIFQFISPDIAGNVDGNSIAIVTDNDLVVFDTTLLPATATNIVKELRSITSKPVRLVINSHWHPDHTGGNDTFASVFPGLEIIASRETRQLMDDTANIYVKTLEYETAQTNREINKELKSGKTSDGKPLAAQDREDLRTQLAMEDRFLGEFKSERARLPTLTFDRALTLYHGGRELRLLALPGHTAGDVAIYLPTEKILLTGDLLAYPVPFCADSHPSAWIASLEVLSRLDTIMIVPGHGTAQRDQKYLTLVLESLRTIKRQVHEALGRGSTLAETQKAVNLDAIRGSFTHNDPDLNAIFDGNFTPIVRQMYDEATEGLEQYQ
jgi:cyclase